MINETLVKDGDEAPNKLKQLLESETLQGKKVLFLMSGGSSAYIAVNVWNKLSASTRDLISVSLTDERFGDVGHKNSNWQLFKSLGADLNEPRHIPVLIKNTNAEKTARIWANKLEQSVNSCDSVVALFGIGVDNHIAGIKPQSSAVYETKQLTISYQSDDFYRISISPAFFRLIDYAAIYAEGIEKEQTIKSLQENRNFHDFPDQLIKQCKSFVVYYKA